MFSMVKYFAVYLSTLMRTELAWACRPSDSAIVIMSLADDLRISSEYEIMLVLFRKSFTDRPEKNLAVPPVGKTCEGPAM